MTKGHHLYNSSEGGELVSYPMYHGKNKIVVIVGHYDCDYPSHANSKNVVLVKNFVEG